ncbi:MAG: uracil-DNA glycosylase, partial [Gammaproteobacteria bacterium]|nr:uracil-DNA glycosylase [Gammaproteobacteria bacterium]
GKLQSLCETTCNCAQCRLAQTRTHVVFGEGNENADVMFIGEAPGAEEDRQGRPFVGPAGQLLTKIIQSIQFEREEVYITNILKCRPPNNRDPHADEVQACSQFLEAQIKLIQPKVILSVGRISAQNLLKDHKPLGKLRGQKHVLPNTNLPLLVTYHPAYLLRNPAEKAKVWQDMKALHRLLNNE